MAQSNSVAHGAMEWLVGSRKSSRWNIAQNNQIHFRKTFLYMRYSVLKNLKKDKFMVIFICFNLFSLNWKISHTLSDSLVHLFAPLTHQPTNEANNVCK